MFRPNVGTSSVGVNDTRTLIEQVLNRLPETFMLDDRDRIIELTGVQIDALNEVLIGWLEENPKD